MHPVSQRLLLVAASVALLVACKESYRDPAAEELGNKMHLRDALKDAYEHGARLKQLHDIAQLLDQTVLELVPKEVLDLPYVKGCIDRGNQRFAADTNHKPYILLIDSNGDRKVFWRDRDFEVLDTVRVISERDIQAGKVRDDSNVGMGQP
jgi:hypothetical protein